MPGAHASSIGTIVDSFALVARHIQYQFAPPYQLAMETKVCLLTTSGDAVVLAGQRAMSADGDLQTPSKFVMVYIAAFEAPDAPLLLETLSRHARLGKWLRSQYAAGATIGAAGTGVFALAEAGILDKGIASVPREWVDLFSQRYPRIRLETRAPVAEHQHVLTTGLLANEWQLATKLVEYVTSTITARWLAAKTGLSRSRYKSAEFTDDPLVAAAQYWLGERFALPFKITDMARELAVSHSTLLRRFQRSLSTTPRAYAQMLRIESAMVMLVKTTRSIDQVSTMLGYADSRSFRKAFREHVRMAPTQYRSRFKK